MLHCSAVYEINAGQYCLKMLIYSFFIRRNELGRNKGSCKPEKRRLLGMVKIWTLQVFL
jgi:hypothetical protein